MDALVSTAWLADTLGTEGYVLLDATYHALDPARDAGAEYAAGHIPGAIFMGLGTLKDEASAIPFMLPAPDAFAQRVGALGISNDIRVILYDDSPHRTAARAWWMLRSYGLRDVAVLDGGLAKWKAEGRPLETGSVTPRPAKFAPHFDSTAVRDLAAMRANLASGAEQVVDARGAPRFTGSEADPRGLADGHIPGSRNLPYSRLLEADGTFKRGDALRAEFVAAGIDLDRPLITTCGSGVTASVVLFAAYLLGRDDVGLYDGSWSEWGALPDTPKETGPAR
jgi:thiosulfate/3-mercaptopyruvate sulfurtransferase